MWVWTEFNCLGGLTVSVIHYYFWGLRGQASVEPIFMLIICYIYWWEVFVEWFKDSFSISIISNLREMCSGSYFLRNNLKLLIKIPLLLFDYSASWSLLLIYIFQVQWLNPIMEPTFVGLRSRRSVLPHEFGGCGYSIWPSWISPQSMCNLINVLCAVLCFHFAVWICSWV